MIGGGERGEGTEEVVTLVESMGVLGVFGGLAVALGAQTWNLAGGISEP